MDPAILPKRCDNLPLDAGIAANRPGIGTKYAGIAANRAGNTVKGAASVAIRADIGVKGAAILAKRCGNIAIGAGIETKCVGRGHNSLAVKKLNYRRIFAVINSYIYRTNILGNGKIHLRVQKLDRFFVAGQSHQCPVW